MKKIKHTKRILSGIRVLDFTDALSGPFCARYLADCGCEVINIERPEGKVARYLPYFKDGHCAEYIENHCGKKSIAIDLKAQGARDLILKLAKVSDIILENYRPGVMAGFGLDFNAFKEVNSSIIMCSISGWGQTGPQAEMIGVDLLVQASRGIAQMSSKAGERPNFVGFAVSDILAGLNAFGAICAALYRRSATGEGEYIDIAMADCAFASLGNAFGTHILSHGEDELRYMVGSFSPSMSPNGAYKGRDGYLVVFARTDELWALLAKVMGKPELAIDPRFNTVENRVKHNEEVTKIMDTWVQQFEKVSDVAALLQSYHILASPVLSIAQVIEEDPQSKAREMIVEMDHPTLGSFKYLNTPLRFRNSRAGVEEPPPVAIGEHTEYVLRNLLKLKDEAIKKLRKERVVFGPEKQPD
jgi:crotonobetainyl-CoA:carnitine CoA-transferase CaiB-like acyl-CoA transferase